MAPPYHIVVYCVFRVYTENKNNISASPITVIDLTLALTLSPTMIGEKLTKFLHSSG